MLIAFTVSPDDVFDEVEAAVEIIAKSAHTDAKILFGLYFNEEMDDEVRVDIIATK